MKRVTLMELISQIPSLTALLSKGTIFTNAVLTGTSFDGADVENADFTDSYIGDFDIRNLCKNPTLKGENPTTGADTALSVGCAFKK